MTLSYEAHQTKLDFFFNPSSSSTLSWYFWNDLTRYALLVTGSGFQGGRRDGEDLGCNIHLWLDVEKVQQFSKFLEDNGVMWWIWPFSQYQIYKMWLNNPMRRDVDFLYMRGFGHFKNDAFDLSWHFSSQDNAIPLRAPPSWLNSISKQFSLVVHRAESLLALTCVKDATLWKKHYIVLLLLFIVSPWLLENPTNTRASLS